MNKLTYELAIELFKYDASTGIMTWRKSRGRAKAGKEVGNICPSYGYRVFGFNNHNYKTHRVAWLITYGAWPITIDHINGIRHDNRIANLRNVTIAQNNLNQTKPKRSNPFLGVSAHRGKWRATIHVNKKQKLLGVFKTAEEAAEAYLNAKQKYHKISG